MEKVRVGLIGLGFMGSTHFRIYEAMENAQIVALADLDPAKRAGDVSSVIGNIGNADNSQPLNMTGITTYESGYDLINDPNVDVVDICCPTPDHAGLIVAALKAGKHVFAEKPFARNLEQAAEIEEQLAKDAAEAAAKKILSTCSCVKVAKTSCAFFTRLIAFSSVSTLSIISYSLVTIVINSFLIILGFLKFVNILTRLLLFVNY